MVRVRRCVSKPILDRWMECARAEMARANMNDIRCPCRDCRLRILIRHDCGLLEAHLIRRGFMDGYTRWMQDDEDDDDVNDAAANGADEDEDPRHEHDQDEDQGAGHQHDQDQGAGREHDEAEGSGHERHDEAEGEGNDSSWLRDPHVQELLLKETSNAKAAAREKARLEQMEKDAVTPLYEGCNEEDTRLTVTLMALEMKAKHKMTDECFDDMMEFWHDRLSKTRNTCPTSTAEAMKSVCPLNLPYVKYHVCIHDCVIYWARTRRKPHVRCARLLDTRDGPRKLLDKWYGTFL